MTNMAYCRFENTLSDFRDCIFALQGLDEGEEPALSRTEAQAAAKLFTLAAKLSATLSAFCEKEVEDLDETDAASWIAYLNETASLSADGEI